jgi:hypothetical protein
LEVAVALFVGAGFAVAVELLVGVVVGFAVVAAAAGVAAGVVALFVEVVAPPASPGALTAPLKAGGVIERIAPSPVTVPAAINNVFLIPVLSLSYLRGF